MAKKRVLSVGIEKASLSPVSAHLEREEYDVELAPTARSAISLLKDIHFDLVVLAHPQEDLALPGFLSELRHSDSKSKGAKLLLLTSDESHPELRSLKERRLEVISRDEALIGDLATMVLSGDTRVPITIMVRLEADLPHGRSLRICQSENLSISGMLVRTEDIWPIDTRVNTSFTLPDGGDPIAAEARVVRLTGPGEIPGIALNFERLNKEDRARLEGFLGESDT